MKSALISIMFLAVATFGYSGNDWKQELNTNGVEVSYQVQQCNGFEVVLLKIKNTNNYAVTLEWANELELQNAPTPVRSDWKNDGSGMSTITLAPGETMEGSCTASALTVEPATMSSMPPLPVQEYNMVNTKIEKQ